MRKIILCMLLGSSALLNAWAGFDEAWIAIQKGNYNEALDECLQPAEVGDGNCMSLVGQLHELGEAGLTKDLAKAAEWQRAGAKTNSRRAQFYYGLALLNGEGVPKDTKQGADLIAKSSAQGYLQAHVLLATLHHAGEGVERDDTKALKLAKTAANEGFAAGHNLLGYIFQHGKGVAKDVMQASMHYRIAAEQGDEYALNNLGLMYARGIGVTMDRVVACVLFDLSAARGLQNAQSNRAKADAVLTKGQIEECTALSNRWKLGDPLPRKSKTWVEPKEPQMRMPIPAPPGGWLGRAATE